MKHMYVCTQNKTQTRVTNEERLLSYNTRRPSSKPGLSFISLSAIKNHHHSRRWPALWPPAPTVPLLPGNRRIPLCVPGQTSGTAFLRDHRKCEGGEEGGRYDNVSWKEAGSLRYTSINTHATRMYRQTDTGREGSAGRHIQPRELISLVSIHFVNQSTRSHIPAFTLKKVHSTWRYT